MYIFFSASVTAVFVLEEEEGKEISFQRSVQGSSSECRINNNVSLKRLLKHVSRVFQNMSL